MFSNWKQEKAKAALVDEAQALADKLASAKPHFVVSYAASAHFWAVSYLETGVDLHLLIEWTPAAVTRFISATQTRINALRKKRDYASSDGLTVWLHTARAVAEPRIAPHVRDIWRQIAEAGTNADVMAREVLAEAGLATDHDRRIPKGFEAED